MKLNNKAFTIIELLVVIAIIGILVLFGLPKFIGYVQKAQLVRIQHDVKVMETIMEDEIINHGYINYDEFLRNEKKLGALILADKLFEKQGHAKFIEDPVEVKHLASKPKELQEMFMARLNIETELGVGGPVIEGTEDGFGSVSQKYKVIPKEWEVKSGTRLKGTFYVNEAGKVYYEPDKPLGPNAKPAKPDACVAPEPLPDYTFEYETGRIAKYHGNAEHLVIPAYFKVDEQCWPVRIIGKGAFMQGGFKSIKLPPTLKEIEPGALEDIGLEDEIIIPGSVDKVGPGAFDNNDLEDIIYEGSPEQVKPGAIPPSFPQKDGTDVSVTYKPPTPGEAGVTVKPNNSGGVTITGGGPGNPHIPPYVNVGGKDKPVTEIGEGAYQGKGLITVDLPFTLEIIEDYAFAGNQLIGVTIPNGVKEIGHYAFGFNEKEKVGNIKGPDTVGTIKTVILKEKEQFNKIDKYGDILEDGTKVNIFKSSGGEMGPDIRLKDHIWVTSAGNVVIDKEYIGNNEDNSALLKDIIRNAEELKKENYEPVSWGELEKALSNAKNIVNDKDSSKKDIDKALDDLESAIANLKEKPGDKTNLITKIDEANKLKEADYESGWNELQNALSDANIVVNNPQATQTEIDRAILDIIGAIDKLIIKPGDKSGLQSKLEEVGKLKEADYVSGWEELQNAITQANKVINKSKATEAEIAIAIENLNKAVDQLTKKPTSPEPDKPIDGDKESTDADFYFIADNSPPNYYTINGRKQRGYFKYVGSDTTVKIPKVIHDNEIKDYYMMFESSNVSKVISDNPNVTDMRWMFSSSKAKTSLDLSSFDTSNVTNMGFMFYESQATSLDLSSFDTSNVTDMKSMFNESQATEIKGLEKFDTSNVTSMNVMFENSQATSLDLSNFDTKKVTDMIGMFRDSQAKSLDLSSFDTSTIKLYNMSNMFSNSQATTGYARTQAEANKFNRIDLGKPDTLNFVVKP